MSSAKVTDKLLADGRRQITVKHQELRGISPDMLSWWYGHVVGKMTYAGKVYPRYLVWHPLDHISYEANRLLDDGSVGAGTRLRITEEFQRQPGNFLQINVTVRERSAKGATVEKRILGMTVVELANYFEPTPTGGTNYLSVMTIGTSSLPGRLGLNKLLNAKVLPGKVGLNWAHHHIEEIGNLEHFLGDLYEKNAR